MRKKVIVASKAQNEENNITEKRDVPKQKAEVVNDKQYTVASVRCGYHPPKPPIKGIAIDTASSYATGRRRNSTAKVHLIPGTGQVTINKRDIDQYLVPETLKAVVRQPLIVTDTVDKFDVLVTVRGGGYTGQASAIRHGITNALVQSNANYEPILKKAGLLARDPKETVRKKSPKLGLRAAKSKH